MLNRLEIKYVPTVELIPYSENARTHSELQVKEIIKSIKRHGWTNPILIDDHLGIIAGHGRLKAAIKMKMNEVPTINLSFLSDSQKAEYIIADNKIALNADWDYDILNLQFDILENAGIDLTDTGFNEEEIKSIRDTEVIDGLCDDDECPDVEKDSITKLGDIYKLGEHRLMCGDSTMIDSVEKLMNGEKADLGFCDPPYNLGFEYHDYDDNKSDKEYIDFSHSWFSNLKLNTNRQIVTLGTKNIHIMASLGNIAGVACWVKKNWITSCHIAKLQQWEPIFFYGDFTKLKRNSDLFEINRVYQKDVGESHTCPKQMELMIDILNHYSLANVLDLFGGSGSTLIACEKINRKCYIMELSPQYCDVIIKRWQKFTGTHAILESTQQTFNEVANG